MFYFLTHISLNLQRQRGTQHSERSCSRPFTTGLPFLIYITYDRSGGVTICSLGIHVMQESVAGNCGSCAVGLASIIPALAVANCIRTHS